MEEGSDVYSDTSASAVLLSEDSNCCCYKAERGQRVGIVGAGPAGLCAARHVSAHPDAQPLLFEQTDSIGGTWVYTENTGRDKNGLPVHSCLYKGLRTNLPKECMQFLDFPYDEQEKNSYLEASRVLQYLNDYADNFNLRPYIKLNHHVKRISPVGKGWSLTAVDLANNHEQVYYFEALMICNGPNSIAVYPQLEGMAKFSGQQLHSREFRDVEAFRDKVVLVIGLGPSGLDITLQLIQVAKKVLLSHNKKYEGSSQFPENVILKPNASALNDKEVHFIDDTVEEVDVIIYCTGYTYHYPFLTRECNIVVDQYVSPLFKHCINIEHPTMSIIGLPKLCPHVSMVDYQVRFFLKSITSEIELPSREEMMDDLEKDIALRLKDKQRKKDFHKLFRDRTTKYFADLSELGQMEPYPPVLIKMHANAFIRAIRDFQHFREATYRIIDDENFEVIEHKNSVKLT